MIEKKVRDPYVIIEELKESRKKLEEVGENLRRILQSINELKEKKEKS